MDLVHLIPRKKDFFQYCAFNECGVILHDEEKQYRHPSDVKKGDISKQRRKLINYINL